MSRQCSERMWGPPGLLFSGCRETRSVEGREGDRGVQLPTVTKAEKFKNVWSHTSTLFTFLACRGTTLPVTALSELMH